LDQSPVSTEWVTALILLKIIVSEIFSLHMAYGENYEHDSLIASEHTPHDQPNPLRELWLAAQENIAEGIARASI
jgi:hypothetical protein